VLSFYGQTKDRVLLTIDGKPVYTSEFIDVYNKNKEIIIDDQQKDLDEYLDLFIDFKLKLLQAYELKLDTAASFKKEFYKYRGQLITPYLKNPEETEKLVKEAYERTKTQVNVSHILTLVKPDASPADTLKAYKKIESAYNKVKSGIPFPEVAMEYSEDGSVKMNHGNLGYFSAFQMTYPFEDMAYSTPKGEISKPFRTRFGYHILKVNDLRTSPGEIEVALIFIKSKPGDSAYAKSLINDLYSKLNQKEDFAYLAKKYSDDKSSAAKGGVLPKFSTGKLIEPLDSMAFSLKKEGEYTIPFMSDYGWHILKLIKKYPVKSFEELENELQYKVRNNNRSVIIKRSLAEKLGTDFKITENKPVLDQIFKNDYSSIDPKTMILSIEDMTYTVKDFNFYRKPVRNKSGKEIYKDFKADKIIEYYKDHLEEFNKEFAKTTQEYKDGLLLFDLLQKNIWKKAETDTVGLEQFFNANREKYRWNERYRITMANCTRMDKAERVRQLMTEGKTTDEIKDLVNEGATIHVIFHKSILEKGSNKLPDGFVPETGISKIYKESKNHYSIINVQEILPAGPKALKETKGQVLNDYQNYLEEKWVEQLRKEHEVIINKRALKKLKKTLI
jgi:peptidyl-prolyl cis-trans isomerase SurA